MDSETFNQKCRKLMETTTTVFFTTFPEVVASSLKLPGLILQFVGDEVVKYALSGMTDLATHVDREWYEPGNLATFNSNAAQLGRNFAKMLSVQREWNELYGSCDDAEEFAGKFYDYTAQLSATAS